MKAGRRNRGGHFTVLAGIVAAVLGSAPAAWAQLAPHLAGKAWEEHIHTPTAVPVQNGDITGLAGAKSDLGLEDPWEVRAVPGTPGSRSSAASAEPALDQTRIPPFTFIDMGSVTGGTGTAVTNRPTDPAIKPTGVNLAPQRSTLEHGSFNLSGDGKIFGLDTWNTGRSSGFNF